MKATSTLTRLYLSLLTVLVPALAFAQEFDKNMPPQDPLLTSYFQNQYLVNPAMAGVDSGLSVNLGYRKQWSDSKDAPVTFALTADYQLAKKMGLGLTVFNDQAGLLRQNRVALTYAYHAQLSEDDAEFLHIGVTGAIDNRHIEKRKNSPADPYVDEFNAKGSEFQADLGIAYTNRELTIQASLPNVTRTFQNSDKVEPRSAPGFIMSASYKMGTKCPQINSIEPKIAFRAAQGYKSVVDLGAKVNFYRNTVNVFAIYHTSNAISAGAGFQFKNSIEVQASYTSQTAKTNPAANLDGNFGLGIKIRMFK
ncbi:PorP/SprF family type IX secretion system membrane protein [Chitinophaga lutea]